MDLPVVGPNRPSSSVFVHRRGAWVLSATALALFALMASAVVCAPRPYFDWDLAVTHEVQAARGSVLDVVMRGVSWAGDDALTAGVLVVVAVLALLAVGARREAAVLLGVVLVGQVLKIGIKHLVGRPRPSPDLVNVLIDAQEVHSFPSGHTVHYVVFFGMLTYLAASRVRAGVLRWPLVGVFGVLVLLIGLSRVYLGAHWTSDIVGGYLLGAAVLAAGVGLYRRVPRSPSARG